MIRQPKCFTRDCVHFIGVAQEDDTEATEKVVCKAFPEGIPDEIAYGTDKHLEVRDDQDNTIVFKKA